MEWLFAYLALGIFVGYFAGLLGIGGGLVMVPMLNFLFDAQQLSSQNNFHLALGTAMAAILFSAISSARTHHAHSAVDFSIVRAMTPGLLIGTALGTLFASNISGPYLTLFFALFVYIAAMQMMLNFKPKATRQLPGYIGMTLVGTGIGAISSLVSIGGGTLSVPFMLHHNVPLKHAVGTSAALGFPIAVGASTGYILTGISIDTLPHYSLGFVYLPALLMLAAGSLLTAPLGAKATHSLPVNSLKHGFALLLIILASKMLWNLLD